MPASRRAFNGHECAGLHPSNKFHGATGTWRRWCLRVVPLRFSSPWLRHGWRLRGPSDRSLSARLCRGGAADCECCAFGRGGVGSLLAHLLVVLQRVVQMTPGRLTVPRASAWTLARDRMVDD